MRRGIAGSEQVLQQVGGVVPATPRVEIGAVGQRPIRRAAIEAMADRIEPRIVAAPLLAHELEQLAGQFPVNRSANGERQGLGFADSENVTAGRFHRGEIQFDVVFKCAPLHAGDRPGFARERRLLGVCGNYRKSLRQGRFRKGEGKLCVLRPVADLAGADEDGFRPEAERGQHQP